jgi:hypothetical protein
MDQFIVQSEELTTLVRKFELVENNFELFHKNILVLISGSDTQDSQRYYLSWYLACAFKTIDEATECLNRSEKKQGTAEEFSISRFTLSYFTDLTSNLLDSLSPKTNKHGLMLKMKAFLSKVSTDITDFINYVKGTIISCNFFAVNSFCHYLESIEIKTNCNGEKNVILANRQFLAELSVATSFNIINAETNNLPKNQMTNAILLQKLENEEKLATAAFTKSLAVYHDITDKIDNVRNELSLATNKMSDEENVARSVLFLNRINFSDLRSHIICIQSEEAKDSCVNTNDVNTKACVTLLDDLTTCVRNSTIAMQQIDAASSLYCNPSQEISYADNHGYDDWNDVYLWRDKQATSLSLFNTFTKRWRRVHWLRCYSNVDPCNLNEDEQIEYIRDMDWFDDHMRHFKAHANYVPYIAATKHSSAMPCHRQLGPWTGPYKELLDDTMRGQYSTFYEAEIVILEERARFGKNGNISCTLFIDDEPLDTTDVDDQTTRRCVVFKYFTHYTY